MLHVVGDYMKKLILKTGILTIGSLSLLSGNTVLCRPVKAEDITNHDIIKEKDSIKKQLEQVKKEMILLEKANNMVLD